MKNLSILASPPFFLNMNTLRIIFHSLYKHNDRQIYNLFIFSDPFLSF